MTYERLSVQMLSPDEWPAISASFRDLTYEQSPTYASAAAKRIGAEAQFLKLTAPSGQLVAATCLRIKRVPGLGRGIAWIASGPLIQPYKQPDPDADTLRAVLAALRTYSQETGHILRLRFSALPCHDGAALDQIALDEGFQTTDRSPPYRTVIIDCDQDDDALMGAQHGKWRNHLRKSLKAGLELETVPISDAVSRFRALYKEVQAAKGFQQPDISPEFYYSLQGSDFSHDVMFARQNGADIAGMTIGRVGQTAIYLFGATAGIGRRCNAGHYLMWESILRCRELGVKWYDLGGIDPDINPTVTEFKQRTGGDELQAAGPYEFRPSGLASSLVRTAETVHANLKKARR